MSVQSQKTTTSTSTYRTMNVASPEPVSGGTLLTTTARSASPLQYAVNGGNYNTLRYLVPMQPTVQQQSYVLVQQPAVMQQMMSPVYLQGVPRVSVSSSLDSELLLHSGANFYKQPSCHSPLLRPPHEKRRGSSVGILKGRQLGLPSVPPLCTRPRAAGVSIRRSSAAVYLVV